MENKFDTDKLVEKITDTAAKMASESVWQEMLEDALAYAAQLKLKKQRRVNSCLGIKNRANLGHRI